MRIALGLDSLQSVLRTGKRTHLLHQRFRTQITAPSASRQHLYQQLAPEMAGSSTEETLNVEAAAAAVEEAGALHLPWYACCAAERGKHTC